MPQRNAQPLLHCSLCQTPALEFWHRARHGPVQGRDYLCCQHCGLVQVPPTQHIPPALEQELYDTHCNDPQDEGYRRFLSRAFSPISERLSPPAEGLDFGSGPGPTLSLMFEEAGFRCTNFDIFYANHPQRLERQYDFITATEVFEHLSQPAAVLDQLCQCLKPGGLLVIMTQRVRNQEAFKTWRYTHDPTHICFFSEKTMDYIGTHWPLKELERGRDTLLWRKIG